MLFVQSFAVDEFYNHKSQTDNEIQIENAEVGDDSQNSLETDVVLPTGLEDDNSEEEIEILVEDSDTGLIAWYIFDGNTTDLINNNNATVSGSVDYIDGVFGKGIELDGNGYVYITVRAYDAFRNISPESNQIFCDNISPTAPSNLMIKSKTSESVVLKWDASKDNKAIAGYKVFCNDLEIDSVTETSYTYDLNQDSQNISFFVKAFDEEGNESEKSNVLVFESEPPNKPSDLKVVKRKHNSVQLSWSPSEDNVGVVLYYVYLDYELVGETGDTTYTITGLSPDTQYT